MPEHPTPPISAAPAAILPSADSPYGTRDLWIVVGFVAAYVLLDWISFIKPFDRFGITPWEPASGLSVSLVFLTGRRHALLLVLAPILADILVRGLSMPFGTLLASSLAIGGVYTVAGLVLRWWVQRDEGPLTTLRNVMLLFIVALAAALVVSLGEIGLLLTARLVQPVDLAAAIMREWVGEFIGVALTTPFVVLLIRQRLNPTWSMLPPLLAIAGLLVLIFSIPQAAPLQLFYLLFVPIIWMALMRGLEGAAIAAMATQIGVILALTLIVGESMPVLPLQLLMIVLTVTGLLTGAAVSDRERAALRMRQLQDAQARYNRLGSMGALSAVLAHEIRQPLTAATTYSRLALEAIPESDGTMADARRHVASASAQVHRASDILRQMHDLVVVGRSSFAPVRVDRLIQEAVDLLRSQLDQADARLSVAMPPAPLMVSADALQISQVIINLVANAVEAMQAGGARPRVIGIEVARRQPGWVMFRITDTGPGFHKDQLEAPITPLASSKGDGLGLGLALCETIVHNHGGALQVSNTAQGAVVEFTLREAETTNERQAAGRSDRG